MFKPPVHRGMKELDRAAFSLIVPVMALRVPTQSVGSTKQTLTGDILKVPKLRNVVNDTSNTNKLILLDPAITSPVSASPALQSLIQENKWEMVAHNITLDYSHWSADEILKAVLPDASEAPTSYEQIGHIAHMNLRTQYHEYRKLIGQVILDKSPTVRTVVNKLDTIDSTFRNFQMEVLAGEPEFVARVRENECVFEFDYSKVYWNSRLQDEHERMVKRFDKGSSICDVMAGVGPFAVPAAKRGCLVWANDLNPASHEALVGNVQRNKVQGRVRTFNLDGREFIRQAFADYIKQTGESGVIKLEPIPKSASASKSKKDEKKVEEPAIEVRSRSFDHVVMNLPAIALEFLDAFRGIFSSLEEKIKPNLPLIHAHCFTKCLDAPERDILQRACCALGYPEDQYTELEATVHFVRRVAPNKDMYCLSLRLPSSIAYATSEETEDATAKKRKIEEQ
ncbi:tRNA(m(1)G37)methyltransferase [Coemansia sp. RSA 2703]|nr:tRNA(m(1)G37)methyltransferase [Coemansia sp. RSA 2703]KAJ2369580.1 tRNA(m(1)G37)methyltransferase [Coemansia sp. RSA 2607]KAJ2396891.1 tRNA(m(1)G37)methyltransferase [Coemansia sp. RSA 2603]